MTQAVEISYAAGWEGVGGAPAVLIPKYAHLPGYAFTKSPVGDTQSTQTPQGCLHRRELSVPHPSTYRLYFQILC